jgi:NADH dehydrogenase
MRQEGPRPAGPPARLVVLGGGYAGAYCARALERALRPSEATITVIDSQNYFVIYPLLVEAGTGSVEPRHAVVSIRAFLRRASFRIGEAAGLDLDRREVICRLPAGAGEDRVPYDHLVIALGSTTRLPPVPGLREHAFQMKSLMDAVALRDRAIGLLELADITDDPDLRRRLLGFVIVGANFTGAEVAGELDAFLRAALREYHSIKRSDIRITLIDHGNRILSALDEELSRYAEDNLRRRGIDILLHQTVSAIDEHSATLKDGRIIPAATTIWAAGIAPPPVLASFGLPTDERGYLICERDLRVKGHPELWGIGDCAVNADPTGQPYPATAQHAVREGAWAARNIARVLRGRDPLPCNIRSRGSLAALGCRTGVATVFGIKLSGFPAWWLWRTVYLLKMPGIARKLRIALDWTLELFFGRDLVQLGVHRLERTPAPTATTRPRAPIPTPQTTSPRS